MNRYKQLLTYIRSAVTRNYSEKSINSILDYISTSKQVRTDNMWRDNIIVSNWRSKSVFLKFICVLARWTYYKSSTKPHWRLWKTQKMTDCGLKLTQRYKKGFSLIPCGHEPQFPCKKILKLFLFFCSWGSFTWRGKNMGNCRRSWGNFTSHVR